MRASLLLQIATCLLAAASALPANAAPAANDAGSPGRGFYAGLLVGPSFASDGLGTELVYGLRGGMKLGDSFSLGLYLTHESLFSLSIPSANLSVGETIIALEPQYYLLNNPVLYVGLKLGIGITSASASSGGGATVNADSISVTGSETDFAAGPAIGLSFPVGAGVSVGSELNAIFVQTPENSLDLVNWVATVTYGF